LFGGVIVLKSAAPPKPIIQPTPPSVSPALEFALFFVANVEHAVIAWPTCVKSNRPGDIP
jgi:hypothetical protein